MLWIVNRNQQICQKRKPSGMAARMMIGSADNAVKDHAGNADPTAAYAVPNLENRSLPEAFEGVDIRYTIGPDRLKEDLVLKHAEAVKSLPRRYAPGD